jgi:hypothetical protein
LQWRADDLEAAAAEEGLVLAKVRTIEEFLNEPQYTEVLSTMPLITVEKIGESEPMPFTKDGQNPLDGIRAFGMGHVIAGGAMGRDLAMYGADVLNIWRPNATEVEAFAWDVQVGMRSTILDSSKEDRATFDNLLNDADVFFANKRPGYLERNGLTAEELCAKKPGLIHAEALRRRATEGGSYRVVVSLTRTVLWLLSLGIFDKEYAAATAGSSDEHTYVAPDLFIAETPLGTYQGMTDQVVMSRTKESYRTVLAPHGSSRPQWL